MTEAPLPIHGFVLAGGKSSRMGQDKVLLPFCGVPLIEIAVAKLRAFCSEVSILGNRDDLDIYAPVVHDLRSGIGPGAAFEAALRAAKRAWTLFIPVDVPLVSPALLRGWAKETLEEDPCSASLLIVGRERQPAFSMLHTKCAHSISQALDRDERRLNDLLYAADADDVAPVCPKDARQFALNLTDAQIEMSFSNINTPQELAEAEAWALAEGRQPQTQR